MANAPWYVCNQTLHREFWLTSIEEMVERLLSDTSSDFTNIPTSEPESHIWYSPGEEN